MQIFLKWQHQITLAFAERVSEVLKQVGPEMPVRSEYAFYM